MALSGTTTDPSRLSILPLNVANLPASKRSEPIGMQRKSLPERIACPGAAGTLLGGSDSTFHKHLTKRTRASAFPSQSNQTGEAGAMSRLDGDIKWDVRQASSGRAIAGIRSSDPQRSFPDGAASRSSTSRSPCRPRSSALSTASPGQCTACGCSLSASCHPPWRHQPTKGRARASASRQWSQSNVSWFSSLSGRKLRPLRTARAPII